MTFCVIWLISLEYCNTDHMGSHIPTWVRWEYPSLSRKLSRSSSRGGSSPKKLLNLRKLETEPWRKGPWELVTGESIVLERCVRGRRKRDGRFDMVIQQKQETYWHHCQLAVTWCTWEGSTRRTADMRAMQAMHMQAACTRRGETYINKLSAKLTQKQLQVSSLISSWNQTTKQPMGSHQKLACYFSLCVSVSHIIQHSLGLSYWCKVTNPTIN